MADKKLLDYVRDALSKGFSFEDIAKLLKKYDYKDREIDEALWVVSREKNQKEEKKKTKKQTAREEQDKRLEKPVPPAMDIPKIPEMPAHIEPKKIKAIPEIESKTEERIQQKFFPEKEKKKHMLRVILEIIGGIILFAIVGILMYIYMWPVLLNIK